MANSNALQTMEYRALLQVANLITTLDLDRVLTEVLHITIDVVGSQKGSIMLLDSEGKPYRRFILQRDLPPEMSRITVSIVLRGGLAGWVAREKRGVVVPDVSQDERWLRLPDDDQDDVQSVLCVPFLFEDQVQGVMTLVGEEKAQFNEDHLELAMAIAGQASAVIHNAYLFDEVQTRERQLETVLQNVGEPLFMLDPEFRFLLVNHEAENLLQRPTHELIGLRTDAIADNSMWLDFTEKLMNADFSDNNQVSLKLRNPVTDRDYQASVATIQGEAELFGYIIVFSDVTSMQDLSRLKSHMLRMASHDLKGPLHIALGYLNMMQMELVDTGAVYDEWVNESLQALERMNHLIDDLLSEERLERERKFRSESIDPYALIQESIHEVADTLYRKGLELQQDIADDLGFLQGDRSQLRQAMINYLSNAIKYTPEGGTVTVRARFEGDRFVYVVEDTGIGIPAELQSRIFRRGYRAEREAIVDVEGNGVGLSLVAEISRRHKGRVWFDSEEGVGSTFAFSIPLEQSS